MSLDDLTSAFRELMARRFPTAQWGSLTIKLPDVPSVVLVVTPRDPSEPAAESRPPVPLSS